MNKNTLYEGDLLRMKVVKEIALQEVLAVWPPENGSGFNYWFRIPVRGLWGYPDTDSFEKIGEKL